MHRKALATQAIPADLNQMHHEAIKFVGFMKGQPLNAWLIAQLYDKIGCDYTELWLHTEVH
jgi:hypothetical protein